MKRNRKRNFREMNNNKKQHKTCKLWEMTMKKINKLELLFSGFWIYFCFSLFLVWEFLESSIASQTGVSIEMSQWIINKTTEKMKNTKKKKFQQWWWRWYARVYNELKHRFMIMISYRPSDVKRDKYRKKKNLRI